MVNGDVKIKYKVNILLKKYLLIITFVLKDNKILMACMNLMGCYEFIYVRLDVCQ